MSTDTLGPALYEYLVEAFHCVPPEDRARSHWVMDAEWVADILQLADSQGRRLWEPTFSLAAPQTLFGKPIELRKGGGAPHLEVS